MAFEEKRWKAKKEFVSCGSDYAYGLGHECASARAGT